MLLISRSKHLTIRLQDVTFYRCFTYKCNKKVRDLN